MKANLLAKLPFDTCLATLMIRRRGQRWLDCRVTHRSHTTTRAPLDTRNKRDVAPRSCTNFIKTNVDFGRPREQTDTIIEGLSLSLSLLSLSLSLSGSGEGLSLSLYLSGPGGSRLTTTASLTRSPDSRPRPHSRGLPTHDHGLTHGGLPTHDHGLTHDN